MNTVARDKGPSPAVVPIIAALVVAGIGVVLAYLASMHPASGIYWFQRVVGEIPGLTDICGDYTLVARAIPPMLVLVGGAITFFNRPTGRSVWGLRALMLAVAGSLIYLGAASAHPGELSCIID